MGPEIPGVDRDGWVPLRLLGVAGQPAELGWPDQVEDRPADTYNPLSLPIS